MTVEPDIATARPGDWLTAGRPDRTRPRRGQIVEVLGAPGHTRFRVRWDEQHDSIVYPQDGVAIVHHHTEEREEAQR